MVSGKKVIWTPILNKDHFLTTVSLKTCKFQIWGYLALYTCTLTCIYITCDTSSVDKFMRIKETACVVITVHMYTVYITLPKQIQDQSLDSHCLWHHVTSLGVTSHDVIAWMWPKNRHWILSDCGSAFVIVPLLVLGDWVQRREWE